MAEQQEMSSHKSPTLRCPGSLPQHHATPHHETPHRASQPISFGCLRAERANEQGEARPPRPSEGNLLLEVVERDTTESTKHSNNPRKEILLIPPSALGQHTTGLYTIRWSTARRMSTIHTRTHQALVSPAHQPHASDTSLTAKSLGSKQISPRLNYTLPRGSSSWYDDTARHL